MLLFFSTWTCFSALDRNHRKWGHQYKNTMLSWLAVKIRTSSFGIYLKTSERRAGLFPVSSLDDENSETSRCVQTNCFFCLSSTLGTVMATSTGDCGNDKCVSGGWIHVIRNEWDETCSSWFSRRRETCWRVSVWWNLFVWSLSWPRRVWILVISRKCCQFEENGELTQVHLLSCSQTAACVLLVYVIISFTLVWN